MNSTLQERSKKDTEDFFSMKSIAKPRGSITKMDTMQEEHGDALLSAYYPSKAQKSFNQTELNIETRNNDMESNFFNNTVNNSPIGTFN